MQENKKYYTPEIEEFHVGFEFEYLYRNSWHKNDLNQPFIHAELDEFQDSLDKVAHAICRVKYLDEQDIEELGFQVEYQADGFFNLNWNNAFIGSFFEGKQVVHNVELFNTYFMIKNKSELKRLMKQLGINVGKELE